ncbi:cell division protein ZapE [Hahella sp. SMD15-11]|uniref:Cell division protein ZapE n=1 Tax=Thermohahella caldifontis TaxID=3142973 RepID=A0AB39V027_9GAMM
MTPLDKYLRDLQREDFHEDAAQRLAVEKLNDLYHRLVADEEKRRNRTRLQRLAERLKPGRETQPVRGLYFWGGVGRGKTYLMDTFYESLPFSNKMRTHFHRFMQRVHRELATLKEEPNPLEIVAERLANEARVICFDEFFVSDIGDAMILANLLKGLFARGVTLVCTSNIVPDGLYKDGLQRARFLPAIDLLNRHTEVINVDGGVDYRLRALEQASLYYTPLDEAAEQALENMYLRLAMDEGEHGTRLEINQRVLTAVRRSDDVVWFEFETLCDGPRSQNDYIELAREFHAVILSGIPVLDSSKEDQARRFINLVDEFYDRNVKLVCSAAAPIDALYQGERLKFEFERTESRLLEMQSQDYLAAPHRG